MTNLRLDWSTAEVSGGTLTVSLDEKPDDEWAASFERTAHLLDHGTWPQIKLKKREIKVGGVEPGSEEKLRFFLESVVQEANAEAGGDADEDDAGDAQEDEVRPEEAEHESDEDSEMTERFRAFGTSD
jgi:hypothetical protein